MESPSPPTVMLNVNIVAMNAISLHAITTSPVMNDKLFSSELDYQVTLSIAESLHRSDLLTDEEFKKAKKLLLEKYNPELETLFSEFA